MWQWKCFSLIFEVDSEITWSEKGVSPSNQRYTQKGQQFLTLLVRNNFLRKKIPKLQSIHSACNISFLNSWLCVHLAFYLPDNVITLTKHKCQEEHIDTVRTQSTTFPAEMFSSDTVSPVQMRREPRLHPSWATSGSQRMLPFPSMPWGKLFFEEQFILWCILEELCPTGTGYMRKKFLLRRE